MGMLDSIWAAGRCEFGTMGDFVPVRVSLGVFFAISGGNKPFVASRTKVMYETLAAVKIPFPRAMTYCVSAIEFVGGCLLVVGLLSSLACFVLLVNMLVAILTTKLPATLKRFPLLIGWTISFIFPKFFTCCFLCG